MKVVVGGGDGYREAEAVMRSKGIAEIRNLEAHTNRQIDLKKKELRQLVGNRYRDLIDSADSIVSMKSSCSTITCNIDQIHNRLLHVTPHAAAGAPTATTTNRAPIYSLACRVKYLVDTPESIWACLDESMFLESASRYVRATHVHRTLSDHRLSPLLRHQSDAFRSQISLRCRDRLPDPSLPVSSYADALSALSIVDCLSPSEALSLFLASRLSWISRLRSSNNPSSETVVSFFCQALAVVQVTVGQVGELFLHALTELPLFYRVILASPPASQLFGGIPSPDEEVRLWMDFRESLESSMTLLSREDVSAACLLWLRSCASEINGHRLVDSIPSGKDLAAAERLIRDTIDNKKVLQGSLDWLRTVFGSEVELPWSRLRELVLQGDSDLWDEIFEDAFVQRMKAVISSGFNDLAQRIDLAGSVLAIGGDPSSDHVDFQAYLSRPLTGGGIWFIELNPKKSGSVSALNAASPPAGSDFQGCLAAYFGPEVSGIKDSVESHCQSVLDDLLLFLESPKATSRLNDLSSFLQDKCYNSVSAILAQVKRELDNLYATMDNSAAAVGKSVPPAIVVERSLFIGRLLFAFQNHLKHIPLILGSPRFWIKNNPFSSFDKTPSARRQLSVAIDSPDSGTPSRQMPTGSRRHTSFANGALLSANESPSPKLEEVGGITRDLCIRAYGLWISWLSNELSSILKWDLGMDDALSATTPLRGWEETVVKQEQSGDGKSEMRIYLPSMPSLYIISFLFRACEEIHRVGGHVIDKTILQKLASKLLEKVVNIYEDFVSIREAQVSEKGVLQILLDLRFAADVLSGDSSMTAEELSRNSMAKSSVRRMQEMNKPAFGARMDSLISHFSGRLDPIDWLTYEPYLWENEKQSYLRHAVLFGFFVQLKRNYRNMAQIPTTNPESNIMRCSVVPRFKYLPISAPALSLSRTTKTSLPTMDDISSRPSWKGYSNSEVLQNSEVGDSSGFGVAAPILKSFMQVGSKFGESTLKLGSILSDGQVGIFKDRSAAAMSTFGDILPAHAAGLLSSFTANRPDP